MRFRVGCAILALAVNQMSESNPSPPNYSERELRAIAVLGAALRAAQSRPEIIVRLLERTRELLFADGATFVGRDPANDDIVLELGSGAWAHHTETRWPADQGFVARVLARGQSLLADTALEMGAPLIAQQTTLGAVWVGRATPFDANDLRVLVIIADIAANALDRMTLHAQSILHAQQLAKINTMGRALAEQFDVVGIYDHVKDVLFDLFPDMTGLMINLFNAQQQLIVPTYCFTDDTHQDMSQIPPIQLGPPGTGTQSRVIHSRQPLIINNYQAQLQKARVNIKIGQADSPARKSSLYVPMLSRGQVIGVMIIQSPLPNRFSQQDADVLALGANTAAVALENARLFDRLQSANRELNAAYDATMEGWSRALDLRDKETEGHTQRVAEMTVALARAIHLSDDELVQVRRGALMHDIGKIAVPDAILLKPDTLTQAEWAIMRRHPQYAYAMLAPIAYLQRALDIPYCHHEKWDGTGYPRGLVGEAIPLAARIFALVDVWDALTSDRPYRQAWSQIETRAYIETQAGLHFDPDIVPIFLNLVAHI